MSKVRVGTRLRPGAGLFAAAMLATFSSAPRADEPVSTDKAPASDSSIVDESTVAGGSRPYSFSGFIRFESALKTTDKDNIVNQKGNPFDGRSIHREGFAPPNGVGDDDAIRSVREQSPNWNLNQVRGKLDFTADFNEHVRLYVSARGIFDLASYPEYDPHQIGSQAAGYNSGGPEYFRYNKFNMSKSKHFGAALNPTEIDGNQWMVDLPSAYVDFQSGALLLRTGIQQIAWGQALFFRVLDVPNGLDLRRHLFLDYAPEEYADERVPALGIRATYQLTNEWELDGFVQKFQPTTYPNANTPYNAIASQFSVHESYSSDYDNKINEGMRVRASFGQWGFQAIAVHRYNPDGTFRWTMSGVNRDIPGLVGSGATVADTPLEVDPSGVWSGDEWFTFAGNARLDGVGGLNTIVTEFPAAGMLGGFTVPDEAAANQELNLFFQFAGGGLLGEHGGGLRGHIIHEYDQENVLGIGGSYVFSGAPGSITDQLIVNLESSYTPNKEFTSPTLSRDYIKKDEISTALVMEKYQRFSQDFPATYLVFQALHKTQSDLFGRYLGCQGGVGRHIDSDGNRFGNGFNKRCSDIQDAGFTALVFAFQQASPTLFWRVDGAVLYDVRGGLLVQPAIRFSPNSSVTLELFYNYLNGSVNGKDNQNIIQTIDYGDELGVRLGYQF